MKTTDINVKYINNNNHTRIKVIRVVCGLIEGREVAGRGWFTSEGCRLQVYDKGQTDTQPRDKGGRRASLPLRVKL